MSGQREPVLGEEREELEVGIGEPVAHDPKSHEPGWVHPRGARPAVRAGAGGCEGVRGARVSVGEQPYETTAIPRGFTPKTASSTAPR